MSAGQEQSVQALVADMLPLYGRDYDVTVVATGNSVAVTVTGKTEIGRLFADFAMRQLQARAKGTNV